MRRNIRGYGCGIDDVERFWNSVDKSNPDGCWPWIGPRNQANYGRFTIHRRKYLATRYLMYLRTGVFPSGFVLHKCNNPPCVNPDHLYVGSASDNWDDRRREHQRRLQELDLTEE